MPIKQIIPAGSQSVIAKYKDGLENPVIAWALVEESEENGEQFQEVIGMIFEEGSASLGLCTFWTGFIGYEYG